MYANLRKVYKNFHVQAIVLPSHTSNVQCTCTSDDNDNVVKSLNKFDTNLKRYKIEVVLLRLENTALDSTIGISSKRICLKDSFRVHFNQIYAQTIQ